MSIKLIFSVSVIFLTSILIISCGPFASSEKKAEQKFRATITEDGKNTYENYFTQLAGLRGEVKYKVFKADGETNPDIKVIQVEIDKKDSSATYKTAKLQYQFNDKTGFIKLAYLEVNGEAQNIIMGAMNLGMMMMESALK
jgi:hypothetical protein